MLLDYLKENYSVGEPIFMTDIDIPELSEENIRYHFKKLTDKEIICTFAAGAYYFPKTNAAYLIFHRKNGTMCIVKKYILEQIETEKKNQDIDVFFLEAALLIEAGYLQYLDELWYIYADEEVRRVRLKESRHYSDEKINFKSHGRCGKG